MAEDAGGDKTEAATPQRRLRAREEGQVARSQDLSAATLMLGALLLVKWFGGGVINTLTALTGDMLSAGSLSNMNPKATQAAVIRSVFAVGLSLAPLFGGIFLVGVLVNLAQAGLSFDVSRLQPRFETLNPANGLSRLFSKGQGPVKFGLSALKLLLVGATAYSAIRGRIGQIVLVQQMDFRQVFGLAGDIIFNIILRVGVLLLVLAIIDYVWQRYRFEQGLRMTKQEVKDEMKNMDGDPHIKARRRQMAIAALRERLKNDVPRADVVVTNPTEFAVALQYDPDAMDAPRVVAKGQGLIAARIREIAIANGIPILERKPLARALYKMCNVGQDVPDEFFAAIAEILAYVYELNGKFKQKHFAKAS